jgi:hypothetical protein
VAKGTVDIEAEALARSLGVVGTVVSSCSSSSLAVPVVEFELLSIDRRDMISSRVDALRGRIEKKEESAVERRLEARFDILGGVEMAAREREREWKGVVDATELKGVPGGGVPGRDDGGGKKERLVLGIL